MPSFRNGSVDTGSAALPVACLSRVTGRKTALTEVDNELTPFVEAEVKEHHARIVRELVAIGFVICLLPILVGLHH